MVTSTNGVTVRPYTVQRRRAVLEFADPDYAGMHIETRLDVDLRTFLDLQTLAGGADADPDGLRAAFRMFGDEILETWNLQDEDGTELTADADGFLSLPPALGTAILGAWTAAATVPGEVSAST
tara:strand:- start:382 stop:753 length:372 start_codon:yes stop_codon:yes gene_type:complete